MNVLYRHYDSKGVLLYVGISLNPLQRLQSHVVSSGWANKIAYIKLEHFENHDEMVFAEKFAIIHEKPVHNIAHQAPAERAPSRREKIRQILFAERSAKDSKAVAVSGSAPSNEAAADYLTVAQVKKQIAISVRQVYRLLSRGELSAFKVGKRTLVTRASLDAYCSQMKPYSPNGARGAEHLRQ